MTPYGSTRDVDDLQSPQEPNKVSTTSMSLRVPTPEEWEQWQPPLTEMRKEATVDVIKAKMANEGLLVTSKMLRDRYRKWGVYEDEHRLGSLAATEDVAPPIVYDTTTDHYNNPTTDIWDDPLAFQHSTLDSHLYLSLEVPEYPRYPEELQYLNTPTNNDYEMIEMN